MHKRARQAVKSKPAGRRGKSIWLTSGLAQVMVLLNGVILTVTVFAILMYFINGMTKEEYQRTSKEAGDFLAEGISGLENSIRIVSSIFQISKQGSKADLVKQIRRTIPNLSKFDQIVFLYESRPGNWQYETIFEAPSSSDKATTYRFMPTHKLITRLVEQKIFEDDSLRVYSDFSGMDYIADEANPLLKSRPFALLKVVEKGNSRAGLIIGISRAALLLDESFIDKKDAIARLTIRERDSRPLYHMDRRGSEGADSSEEQQYNFSVGSTEWKVILGFTKEQNIVLLEKLPYVVLFFGIVLTAMGILFVRNNYKYSARLARMNQTLEGKNFELENEVSERERLNQVLVKSEKENRAIIDSVSDIIFETDTSGRILFLSAAWRKITGFDPERSKDADLFSMLHVEDQDKQRADFGLMVRGQKQAYRSFSRLRISDGTFRAVELAMSMIRQDENKNLRVVGTITDVEERRRAERALAEAEKKYRTIVENAAGGLYQITPEGMYLSANPAMARILGYASVEEMLRVVKNANGRVYPDIVERENFIAKELIPAGQIFATETKALRKDKVEIWVRENIRVVKDESGNVLYFEGSMEDITKRKEADIALMEAKITSDMANRAKTEFIANMSHELRTPLNAIIGFSEIIANQVMGPIGQDIYVEYAAEVHKSGRGLLNIINEILDISKIESGKKELKESEFLISDCIGSCKELLDAKIKSKRIVLIDKTADLPKIIAEETSIKQVVRNILSNAVQFTPEEGRITLFCNYDHDGSFRLCISDTGVGLTQKEIEKALSPFGQIDNALGRSTSGTGLGLPLSKALIDLHGGGLEILSEKGFGTTVAIILPAKRVSRTAEGSVALPAQTESQKS